jgi:hypothetical protein
MKDQIIEVLKRYEGTQVNIDSEMAQNQIADEIVDNIRNKYIVTPVKDALDGRVFREGEGWIPQECAKGWLENSDEFDG